jgi:hypothetical protein
VPSGLLETLKAMIMIKLERALHSIIVSFDVQGDVCTMGLPLCTKSKEYIMIIFKMILQQFHCPLTQKRVNGQQQYGLSSTLPWAVLQQTPDTWQEVVEYWSKPGSHPG